ncbi:MAG: VWA domain-containing protein, partial [Phycisphaeraceae bacterium]|nr:VWA domain-containing protein [Phycisphaeraceae bacterium]
MRLRLLPALGVLGLLGLITSCGTTPSTGTTSSTHQPKKTPSGPVFDPNAPTLVIALDAAESMLESDPDRFSVEGARLAGALLDTRANVGVLSFHRRSRTWFPLSSLRGVGDRERLEEAVGKIRFRGQTDFKRALDSSYAMLARQNAKPGSAVLFLPDGRPDLG